MDEIAYGGRKRVEQQLAFYRHSSSISFLFALKGEMAGLWPAYRRHLSQDGTFPIVEPLPQRDMIQREMGPTMALRY
jgi:hypothetical protein